MTNLLKRLLLGLWRVMVEAEELKGEAMRGMVVGMPISRAEALRIAHEVIERAERGRQELAKWEAQRGLSWGEE